MPRRKKQAPKKFKVPGEVAVFPLPNVILFPKVELPLFVFEPRYRKLLADTLAGSKFMAISLLKKGWESKEEPYPSHDVVGVGYVKAVVQNSDGTSHILLKGMERARVLRYVQTEPYRVAAIRLVPDRVIDRKEIAGLGRTLRGLFLQKIRFLSERPGEALTLPKEFEDPVALSSFVSFTLSADPYLKQDLFETTNLNCRMKHLISLLRDEINPPGSQN